METEMWNGASWGWKETTATESPGGNEMRVKSIVGEEGGFFGI